MDDTVYDLIVIGAGPCGLAVGIEAQKHDLKFLILEKGSIAESVRKYPLYMTFFSTAENIEIGGLPMAVTGAKASRGEALQYYRRVTEYFKLPVKLYTAVVGVEKEADYFVVRTSRGGVLKCKHVVLATGYFDFPRELNVPGEDLGHVSKYYDEPYRYVHSRVVIVGGGNSAVSTALDLYRHGAEVTMIVRKGDFKPTAKYWLIPDLRNRVKEGKIQVKFQSEIARIEADKVWYREAGKSQLVPMPADFVLLMVGYTPDVSFMRSLGVSVSQDDLMPTYNSETFETNVPGVYLAGTVVCGVHTEKVFIENGRHDGKKIIENILKRRFVLNS